MIGTETLAPINDPCAYECGGAACLRLTAVLDRHLEPAPVHDLSTTGAVLVLNHTIEPSTPLTIELYNPTGRFWHRKTLFVHHVEIQADGTYHVEGSFTRPLSEMQLRELLA